MNMDAFHKNIRKTIDECSYDFFVVRPNKNIKCTCVTHATKQADPDCKLCLGTGYKIIIKKFNGSSNEELKGANSGGKAAYVSRTYFVYKNNLREDDLIVDDDEIFYVFRVQDMKALKGFKTHQEAFAVRRNNDHTVSLKNFKELIKPYL